MSIRTIIGIATLAIVTACSGADATGPVASAHPAIPIFRTQGNCQAWSCSTSVCGRDPAVYGACCTSVNEYAPPVAPPSCESDVSPFCQVHETAACCVEQTC